MTNSEISNALDREAYALETKSEYEKLSVQESRLLQKIHRLRYLLMDYKYSLTMNQRIDALFLIRGVLPVDLKRVLKTEKTQKAIGFVWHHSRCFYGKRNFADLIGISLVSLTKYYEKYLESIKTQPA